MVEACEDDIAISINKNILRCKVPVGKSLFMKCTECQNYLRRKELHLLLTRSTGHDPMMKDRSRLHKVEEVVDVILITDYIVHANYKWMLHLLQDFFLDEE